MMKAGQQVTFVNGGVPHPAQVTGVVGAGPSTFKIVDLVVDGAAFEAVYHASDAPDRYWTMDKVAEPIKARRMTGGKAKASATIGLLSGDEDA